MKTESYVPALGFRSLTRIYDRVLHVAMRDERFKAELIGQANVHAGHRVLDLGCGTSTLTVMLKRTVPQASVVGLDGDPDVLGIARAKAAQAGVAVELVQGLADEAPFAPHTFDRVVSSLFFHHLTTETKRRVLRRVRELLTPEGELHVADWGAPHDALMRTAFLGVQLLDGFETTGDNVRGRLPELMREAGFGAVTETARHRTMFGSLSLYRAES